jgi:hypothetical protein
LFSTKLVPLSFDYFIDAQRGYKDMLTLAEFHTSLIDNWPGALDELRRDPTDLSQSVDSNLSGTNARQLFAGHPDFFKMDDRNITIIVRRLSDYQEPFHGSTLVGSYSTGGDNDVVCNIGATLEGKPEYCRVTHIVSGGKHIPNPEARQEYDVEVYGKMMYIGFRTDVNTKNGIVRDVFVRVVLLNYCADGPKFAADMSIYDQPNVHTLDYMLKGMMPLRIGKKQCWCLSYSLGAKVRSAKSALVRAKKAHELKGRAAYEKESKLLGMKGKTHFF